MGRKYFKKNEKKKGKSKRYRLSTQVVGGFPQQCRVHLKYVQHFAVDPLSSSYQTHIFRANSIYDPDWQTGGHTPANAYRFWEAYGKATVTSSKCKIISIQRQAETQACIGGIMLDSDATAVSSLIASGGFEAIIEQPYNNRRTSTYGTLNGAQIARRPMRSKFSATKFFDRPYGTIINSAEFSHNKYAPPNREALWIFWASSIGNNNPGRADFLIEIDYSVAFSMPLKSTYSNIVPPPLAEAEKTSV